MFLPSKMVIIASDPSLYGGTGTWRNFEELLIHGKCQRKMGNQEMVEDIIYSTTFLSFGEVVAAISFGKPITTEFPHCKNSCSQEPSALPPTTRIGT